MTISRDIETARQQRATPLVRCGGGPSQAMRSLGGAVRPYIEIMVFIALCVFLAVAATMMADLGWPE